MNKTGASIPLLPVALLALGAIGALVAVAFAGWMEHGASIFLSLAESGMAWCF